MRLFLPVMVVLLLVACTNPAESDTDALRSEINRFFSDYCNDVRKDGLTAEFKYLDHSEQFHWTPPGYKSSISYDSVATILRQNAPNYRLIENKYRDIQITRINEHLVSYFATVSSKMTDISGKQESFTLNETGVLIKRKDGWKLLSGATNMAD